MDWIKYYRDKLITNEEAASKIQSHDVIALGLGLGGVSHHLLNPIIDRGDELENVTINDAVSVWPSKLMDIETMRKLQGKIDLVTYFGMNEVRDFYKEKLTNYFPNMASDTVTKILATATVYMVMVTPPNDEGYVNFGVTNFYHDVVHRRGESKLRLIMAEVNDQMPVVFGDNWAHVTEFDYFIESSMPLPEVKRQQPNKQEQKISDYVLEIIDNGDTLQLGIGAIPDAVAQGLFSKKQLGIHSELLPGILPDLVEKGVITNENSVFRKGISVAGFGLGSQEFYDFIKENPLVELYPTSKIITPFAIAKQPHMKAINNALMVDLTGQICAEGIGTRQISGAGGQPDCHIGAFYAEHGRAITLLTAARKNKDGELLPSIVPVLPSGTPVTVARNFADTIITEYGVAELRHKSTRERAKALIGIAHPDLREGLKREAEKLF